MENKKQAVIVFARYPDEGKVKTRLAESLGNKFAKDFYKICAEHTFEEILKNNKSNTQLFLFYSDGNDKDKIKKWTNSKFLLSPQKGKDLGGKMLNAFQSVFKSKVTKVVIIGTDLPEISSEIIDQSFVLLENNDIVIGPATDGGYYLLGMKKVYDKLFINLPWSTEKLFEKTIKVINELNLKLSILPKLSDIDNEEDLKNWINKETILKPEKINLFVKTTFTVNNN